MKPPLFLDPAAPLLEAGAPPAQTPPEQTPPAAPAEKPAEKAPEKAPEKPLPIEDMPGLQAFAKRHMGEGVDDAEVKKEIEKAKKQPEKPKKPAAAAPAKPKSTPRPAAAPATTSLTAAEIAEASARGVATALAAKPAEKKEAAPDPFATLPPDEKERVEVLQQMEKMYPDRYKGAATKYANAYTTAQKKLNDYATEWEAKHPGETFDETAPEHEEFMEKHGVDEDWEQLHFNKAAGALGASAVVSESQRQTTAQLAEISRKEKLRDAQSGIIMRQVDAAKLLWKSWGKDFEGVITPQGALDIAKLKELHTKDPVGGPIRTQAASDLSFEIQELHKMWEGLEQPVEEPPKPTDPQFQAKNAQYLCHKSLMEFALEQERELMRKPAESQTDDKGRIFLPAKKFYALPKADRESNHWTFNEADLITLRVTRYSVDTQESIDREKQRVREIAKAMGYTIPDNATPSNATPATKTPEEILLEATKANEKPESPSAASESRLAANKGGAADKGETALNYWGRRHMGIAS